VLKPRQDLVGDDAFNPVLHEHPGFEVVHPFDGSFQGAARLDLQVFKAPERKAFPAGLASTSSWQRQEPAVTKHNADPRNGWS